VLGDNTDGVGLVRDLSRNLHFDLRSSRTLLMGAGGAAQAVVGALREAGVAQLVVVNRTESKRASAQRASGGQLRATALSDESFGLIITRLRPACSTAAPPVPPVPARGALAYDMVYGQQNASRAARARRRQRRPGMLVASRRPNRSSSGAACAPDRAVLRKLRGG
jgi:shikimate dehydrogenase